MTMLQYSVHISANGEVPPIPDWKDKTFTASLYENDGLLS